MNLFANIKSIEELIESSSTISIVIHVNPDGDALGAGLALYHFFCKQNKQVSLVSPNRFPSFLAWMPGAEDILIHTANKETAADAIEKADLIFCIDFNAINRVDKLSNFLKVAKGKKILIDHHLYPEKFTDFMFSENNTSSTSELIYEFIVAMDKEHLIDKTIAECLYVGIVTDTGSFSYSCNNKKTYQIIAKLFNYGIDGEHIHTLVYGTHSENKIQLLGFCLSEKLIVLHEFHTAYIVLTKDELKKFNYQIGDTEEVVNYALSIKGIIFAALFMERKYSVKVSLRSKGNFSVEKIAREHFEGGGHRNASGGDVSISLEKAVKKFESLLPMYKDELKKNI